MSAEFLKALSTFVPLFQTVLWITFIGVTVKIFYSEFSGLLHAVQERVKGGSSVKAGPFELGEDLRDLTKIDASRNTSSRDSNATSLESNSWEKQRKKIYEQNRNIFVAHVISPSQVSGMNYDIFIYLIRHRSMPGSIDFSDVNYAEFFFGKSWGNRVFRGEAHDRLIGIRTSSRYPFLCICRVNFKDGSSIELNRYIDFEMSRLFDNLPNKGLQQNRGLSGRL